jgi:hypothetical protein
VGVLTTPVAVGVGDGLGIAVGIAVGTTVGTGVGAPGLTVGDAGTAAVGATPGGLGGEATP